jgi:aryl-alcohol dehydrogenase-like predicted oxidoreductase
MVNDVAPAGIRQECEASLRRLHVDCIDLYQIHWPGLAEAIEDSWGAMARLQEEGKVRYIGVSNFGVDLLERCRKVAPVQSLQPPYSLLVRNFEETTKEYCRANHIGVVAYSPMQSGLLSGRFDRAKMASDDWRQQVSLFRDPKLSNALAYVERLRPIASRRGISVGQLAIAWVLREEPVTSAIVGARTAAQVEENLAGSRWSLPASVIEEIGRINPG